MAKISIKIEGIEDLLKKFDKLGPEATKMAGEVTQVWAVSMAGMAVRNLNPYITGYLKDSIQAQKLPAEGISWAVTVSAFYGAFVEFGTGPLTSIPNSPGWSDMARQFKGKRDANPGMNAQPYLYPAFVEATPLYLKDLKRELKILINE